ncbi:uncharacterized protein LOC117906934 [Vitis riparia]|uniref:uncharacterized protein LOC117906934 n=1 Tax=Vitis riparia TaxID=96939 RepID=UPI00155A9300|nr:uncharacterized protein LOC117906934 [Vitis riparia]
MGGCVSSVGGYSNSTSTATAKLISLHGELREYSAPVTVSQVLHFESSSSSCFVCNSDSLYYDDYIPAMNADDELLPGQIYFLLSATKLQYRLTASEMAALAVKASIALQNHSKKAGHRRNNKSRISPVLEVNQKVMEAEVGGVKKSFEKPALGVSRHGSVRKLQRHSSRRARMAVRSFRLRLTTIYEGSVL